MYEEKINLRDENGVVVVLIKINVPPSVGVPVAQHWIDVCWIDRKPIRFTPYFHSHENEVDSEDLVGLER